MIVASIAGLVLIDRSLDDAADVRLEERRATVGAVAEAVDLVFDAALDRLEDTAARLEPWAPDPDADQLRRAEATLAVPGVLGGTVVLVDTAGIVRVAGPDAAPLLGQELHGPAGPSEAGGDVRTVIELALGGSPAMSGVVPDQDGGATVQLAVPVHDGEGAVTGAVVSRVDPTTGPIADLLSGTFPGSTRLALATDSGAVVSGDDGVRVTGAGDPNTQLPEEEATAGVVPAYRGEAGMVMSAVTAPLRDGWRLVAFEPYDALRSPLRVPFWIATGVLTTVALLAGAGFALGEMRARRAEHRAESTKRSLLAVAGHELRTPLTVVRGLGQTLVERWDELPERTRWDMVRTVERQSRLLDHLVERLLYAAQLETGGTAMVTPRPTDVGRAVRRAVDDHAALAPAHEIRSDVDGPLTARADPKALDQVLFHLLDNAVRYSPSGGRVFVTAGRVGRRVEIVVEDEGVGLPADVDAIFDRFVQGEAVTTRTVDEGGVGLGLHIVRTLVELMGGSVRAEPRQPEGARFTVTLPVASS